MFPAKYAALSPQRYTFTATSPAPASPKLTSRSPNISVISYRRDYPAVLFSARHCTRFEFAWNNGFNTQQDTIPKKWWAMRALPQR